jgi:FtsP/CotA-like multicopper oxidase with cupredoxin domain
MAVAFLSLSAAAGAQQCPNVEDNQELRKIPELVAAPSARELSTTFDVQMQTHCIPTKTVVSKRTDEDGTVYTTYKADPMPLRTFVYPDPANPGKMTWGLPGPTLRVRKANQDGTGGQGIAILLKNSLPASNEACENACPSSVQCAANVCQTENLNALVKACSSATKPNNCCCVINCTQKSPNCFHGDNTTNLHFHGSHASPQEPQDFALLELRPGAAPADGGGEHEHGSHGIYSKIAYGQYQYRVDPFRYTQPAGTHWYHPHKHGSVGLQVANGMAGAMIIEGSFDDWLKKGQKLYDDDGEKLMVVQQIALGTNLFQQGRPRQILVNGQLSPRIKVEPGEIQRWRIVNATMSSQAMLNIKLDPRLVLKQIAMDGIRFSPANYLCQPLANFDPSKPPASFPCDFDTKITQITLAPGNRVDFLVRMPLQETDENHPPLRIERRMVDIVDEEQSQRMFLREEDEEIAPGLPEPALFQVIVDDGIEGNDAEPKLLSATAPKIPDQIPALPDDIKSVAGAEARVPGPITMTFEQVQAVTGQPWPYTGSPLSQFKIDGRQFNATCANVTTQLDTAKVWTVSNATRLPHPFHIHTNPFALLDYAGAKLQPGGRPEPIWMDTMPLPLASLTPCANPGDCPGAIPCDIGKPALCTLKNASMTFVQRYEEFTGEYVLHCHFLGHEDRGMMFSVQTVCSDKYPTSAGKYGHSKRPEECAGPSPFPAALPPCE